MLYATTSRLFLRFLRKDTDHENASWETFFAGCDDVAVELRQQVSTLRDCVRRGAFEEIKSFIRALRQRKETQTFIYTRVCSHGPAFRLRQICYRIRWMPEHTDYAYDLNGLYDSLMARIMLGLLESQLIMRTIYKQAKLVRKMTPWESRLVGTTIIKLRTAAATDEGYVGLLLAKLRDCSVHGMTTTIRVQLRRPEEPGFRFRTEQEKCDLISRLHVNLPSEILEMPVDAQICWECRANVGASGEVRQVLQAVQQLGSTLEERHRNRRARKCSACNIARYCSPECQRAAWSIHKDVCGRLRETLSSAKFQQRLQRRTDCSTWGELLLKELSDRA